MQENENIAVTPSKKLSAWLAARTREAYKPHYRHMNKRKRMIYKELLYALVMLEKQAVIPLRSDAGEINDVISKLFEDNAVIFYAEVNSFSVKDSSTVLHIRYSYPTEQIEYIAGVINTSLERLKEKCKGASLLEKEIIVHNLLVKSVVYDLDEQLPIYKSHAAFLYQRAVCSGISWAACLMFGYLGIDAFRVRGDALPKKDDGSSLHAWNMVRCGNAFYHLDITFDNGLTKGSDYFTYDYFNLTDEQARRSRIWYDDYIVSGKERVDYYTLKGLRFSDSERLRMYIRLNSAFRGKPIRFAAEGAVAALSAQATVSLIRQALQDGGWCGCFSYSHSEKNNTWCVFLDG